MPTTARPSGPARSRFEPAALTRDVIALVTRRLAQHPGKLYSFAWPVTRSQALQSLRSFAQERLPLCGRYQDAMWPGDPWLHHAHLSAALNLKLLNPREVVATAATGHTGVLAIDQAVRSLHATDMLHNHARMWLASYVVHLRKVHWRCGADGLYRHLLDGDLASNPLSWQWVAGSGSHKPYLFSAENVARYADASWHSPGSVIDASYESLGRLARQPTPVAPGVPHHSTASQPPLLGEPPQHLDATAADPARVKDREVWLVHLSNLGVLPALPPGTQVLGPFVADFHCAWPRCDRRWRFVGTRMAELTPHCWHGDTVAIGDALAGAQRVRSIDEPHLAPWLARWAGCVAAAALCPPVDQRCDSFSPWWTRASRGLQSAADLLAVNEVPAW